MKVRFMRILGKRPFRPQGGRLRPRDRVESLRRVPKCRLPPREPPREPPRARRGGLKTDILLILVILVILVNFRLNMAPRPGNRRRRAQRR